jgi:HEAT repeat protein
MMPKDSARLWEELRHRDPEEKVEWIRSLAEQPTPDSLEVLLDVLKQESWFLRDQAARVLATLGEEVIEPLIEYLGSGLWYTRTAAASALGRMGLPVAAAPLTALLRDANRTVRDAAWDALVLLGRNEMGLHALAEAFLDLPERAQRFALDGLMTRDPFVAEQVARLLSDPSLRSAAEGHRPPRTANQEEGLAWDDVVGGGSAQQGSR